MENKYERLKAVLPDTARRDSPPERDLFEILFTDEEAQIAVQLRPTFENVIDITERSGIGYEQLLPTLERMADKGLVYLKTEGDTKMCRLMSPLSMIEWNQKGIQQTPEMVKVAHLIPQYYDNGQAEMLYDRPIAYARVIPFEEALPEDELVHPWERISTVIEGTDFWGVTNCTCRIASDIRQDGCGHHAVDVCPNLGDSARYMVERGLGRSITRQELYDIQERARDEGLVFTTNNAQEFSWICNCCGCCCSLLWGINRLDYPNAVARSNFVSKVDMDECTLCEVCLDKCPVDCISLISDDIVINEDRCIGCGVCVVSCPTRALSLARRRETVVPPPTLAELAKLRNPQ